jgi:hypothetical protein
LLETKQESGFEFVKAGEFSLSDTPCRLKNYTLTVKLNLYIQDFEKADETAYFITCEDEIVYVGEYTYNLKDRWLTRGHANHHMHDNIETALKSDKQLYLWLCVSPYCDLPDNCKINISKSLEQKIMNKHLPEWNRRNKGSTAKDWRAKHCKYVTDILEEYNQAKV